MEVKMKRFAAAISVFGLSILAVWAIFQATVINDNASSKVRPSHNELFKILNAGHEVVIPIPSADARTIAPVFDANGKVVSDPSGVLLNAGQIGIPVTGSDWKIAPVFDTSGMVISDPSGTILNDRPSNVKIAPVFDANGAVVSDPTGTILNSANP
jgi:hypothetical protein